MRVLKHGLLAGLVIIVGCTENDAEYDAERFSAAAGNYTAPDHRAEWGINLGYSAAETPICPRKAGVECQAVEADGATVRGAALAGDLAAQRRLITMFEEPDVIQRPIQVCAWNLVVAAHPENQNSELDGRQAEAACSRLTRTRERRGAQWLANDIHRDIYGTDLPPALW